jgi:hypothetical protein
MRLIAFGCSLTYGHGLSDCIIPPYSPGPSPSKLAWPAIIASELKIELINLSTLGSSNKRIWHNIINFNFKTDDIVFIMWSYPERDCILKSTNSYTDIGRWIDNCKIYYNNYYSKYDSDTMTKLYINHANQYLNDKKITTYNLTVNKEFKHMFFSFNKKIPYIPVCIDKQCNKFELGLDNLHPNEACHKEVARLIMNQLNMDNNIPKQKISKLRWIKSLIKFKI